VNDKDNERDDHHRIYANLNDGQKLHFMRLWNL
jgi:hypothetical protein